MSARTPEDDERAGALADELAAGRGEDLDREGDDEARVLRVADAFAALLAQEAEALDPAALPSRHPALPEDYELIEAIGHGGMGVVYKARQRSLDRIVAVKVLHPGDRLFGHAIRRFQREARVLARLRHPNIVAIHEVGEVDEQVYFTMEWIDGRPLNRLLEEGRLTRGRAVHLVRQVAAAVAYVHDHGLIHRDLKPENILVDDEDVTYVTDFGLALELGTDSGLTLTGQVVGTPAYMSPEQARGNLDAVSEASDVYALGVILYECLTGRRPFEGLSPAEQVYAVIHEDPPWPRRIDRRIPEDLQVVCMKAMSKRRELRYPSARALLEDLQRYEAGRPIRARPPSRTYRFGRFLGRHQGRIGWATAALAVVALCVVLAVRSGAGRESPPLAELAADMASQGHLDAAMRLYETAFATSDPPDAALFADLTETRLAVAADLWKADRAADAAALLDRAHAEGVRHFGASAWEDAGRVAWAGATAHALAESGADPAPRFQAAFDAWLRRHDEAWRRAWSQGGRGPTGDRKAVLMRAVIDPLVADLAGPPGPARDAALRQVVALVQVSGLVTSPVHGLLPAVAQHGAPLMRSILEIVLAPELRHPQAGIYLFRLLRNPVRAVADERVEAALAGVATTEDAPDLVRRGAALLLLDIADIPLREGFMAREIEQSVFDPRRAVAEWERLRALAPIESYRGRVRLAVEELRRGGTNPFRHQLARWFGAHTGVWFAQPEPIAPWYAEHGHEDPRAWLAGPLGLRADRLPAAEDAGPLLHRYPGAGGPQKKWIHNLLTLIAPRTGPPLPRAGLRGMHANDLMRRWRDVVRGPLDVERLRWGRLVFRAGRWALDPAEERRMQVAVGGPVELKQALPLGGHAASAIHFTFPGILFVQDATASYRHMTARLEWTNTGPLFRVMSTVRGVRGRGYSSSSGSSGNQAEASYVMTPDLKIGGWSDPDPFRHEFSLVVLESADASEKPWTIDDWRARVIADLGRLADGARIGEAGAASHAGIAPGYRFLMDRQKAVMNIAAIATRLPLPEALPALRVLQPRLRDLDSQKSLVAFARLMADDETALDDEKTRRLLASLDKDGYAELTAGRDGESWIRLLRTAKGERIRAFALERLEDVELSARAAGDLLDARRGGEVALPARLEARLAEGPTDDRSYAGLVRDSWPWFLGALLLLLAAAYAAARTLWPGRAAWKRWAPASWLVLLGMVMTSVHVVAYDVDHLPDALGFALAAVGAAVLARSPRTRRAYLPALFLGGAGALNLLRGVDGVPPMVGTFEALCAALGVITLPLLSRLLLGPVPERARELPSLDEGARRGMGVRYALLLALGAVLVLVGASVAAVLVLFLVPILLIVVLEALVRSAGRPRVGVFLWIGYVLPVMGIIGVTFWVQATGAKDIRIDRDWALALFAAACLCVIWVLLALLKAARARAAFARLATAA